MNESKEFRTPIEPMSVPNSDGVKLIKWADLNNHQLEATEKNFEIPEACIREVFNL